MFLVGSPMPEWSIGRGQTKGSPRSVCTSVRRLQRRLYPSGAAIMSDGDTLKISRKARGIHLDHHKLSHEHEMCQNKNIVSGVNGTQPSTGSAVPGSDGSKAISVVIPRNPYPGNDKKRREKMDKETRVGTWNVRTMLRKGKLENVKVEMKRSNINILGLSEVRWKDGGDFWSDDVRVIYSGGNTSQRGVAVVLDKKAGKAVITTELISDRVISVELKAEPVNTVIVQVYLPTGEHSDDEVELVYEQIEEAMGRVRGNKNLIVMGDWNAVVGQGKDGEEVGEFGLGKRNERGQKLIDFCRRNNLCITNTLFQHHNRRRYTWKKPGDTDRYQIDYILVRKRFRNSVKNSRSYPGADVDSDHNLVMMRTELKFKKIFRGKTTPKWNLEALKSGKAREFQESVSKALEDKRRNLSIDEEWEKIKNSIRNSAQVTIGRVKQNKIRKPWVTAEMINKMEERRKWKRVNTDHGRRMYRALNNELRRETNRAREQWWKGQCNEIEKLNESGRVDLMYRKVKQLTGNRRQNKITTIKDNNGKVIRDPASIRERWKEYVEELYGKEMKPTNIMLESKQEVENDNVGPGILNSEIDRALNDMKGNKATGIDEIPVEFLKNLRGRGKREFYDFCRKIYEEGKWPEDFTKTILIPLQKKNNATECRDYRTISLISHAAKVVLRVLNKRIEGKIKEQIGEDQFGFQRGKGTRDAIGVMRVLVERNLEFKKDVFACFVDFEKAFDRVQWPRLMGILKKIGLDWKDRRLVQNLYLNQTARVRITEGESEWAELGRGVRQGCPLSPALFNIYAEEMVNEAWEEINKGVKVGGEVVKSVRYADDKAIVCDSERGLQILVNALNNKAREYGMKINVNKTKVMRFTKGKKAKLTIRVEGEKLEQVDKFSYLGSVLSWDGRCGDEVRKRIALAKEAFMQRRELMTKGLDKGIRKRLVKSLIWSVLLYGCETWTLRKEDTKRLEAFEMWVWRRMEKVSWVDRKTNIEVLEIVGEERALIEVIKCRQKKWVGQILRGEGLLKKAIEGRMQGKRQRGRQRQKMLDELKGGVSYQVTKERALNREY